MKCGEVRLFFSEIAGKSVTTQIPQQDLDYLATNGYLNVIMREQYDIMSKEVADLDHINEEQQGEIGAERGEEGYLDQEERRVHSVLFHFEGREKRESELDKVRTLESDVAKHKGNISSRDSQIKDLIQKKSVLDRMVPYTDRYVSLTGLGVVTLSDLNVRNYRVSEDDFASFKEETAETSSELKSIAEIGRFHELRLMSQLPDSDPTLLWGTSIGLAKSKGDPQQIDNIFLSAMKSLEKLHSTVENKLMAAEIISTLGSSGFQKQQGGALDQAVIELEKLDHELRHHANVPRELSVGIAAIMMYGKRFDGTYPTDRFTQFTGMTSSYESAAILSIDNVPVEELESRFRSFKMLFNSWGYQTSDDTELSSAFLAVSGLTPDDLKTKLTIVVDALKAYLEYPLVAASILSSIQVLEANETLDLLEKAYSMLSQYAVGLERSELLSLSVRMIHGIKNELVKELDSTANINRTPVQFTYVPTGPFFIYYVPLVVAHSSYYSTFSGIGGFHPAHVHGVGGFAG
ncbi:MAG: hypothetical protein M1556_05005 [Candidatus Thermoplasmatota archaeon]|jgi:hypothetical protein|nr:hypothetical protein [Candidatus Thermoplasmatota archaeon]